VTLPYEMISWVPATSRRILGIDSTGRLHSICLDKDKGIQIDYIADFTSPTAFLTCSFAEQSSHVYVFNGTGVEGVAVDAEGKLGIRVNPEIEVAFDTARALTNRLGLCVALNSEGEAAISAAGETAELGPVHAESPTPIAIAPYAPMVAVAAPDLRLTAAFMSGSSLSETKAEKSPLLDLPPQGMVWANNGQLLAVSFEDKTWRVFRPVGLSQNL
jgi:hypothetical protein